MRFSGEIRRLIVYSKFENPDISVFLGCDSLLISGVARFGLDSWAKVCHLHEDTLGPLVGSETWLAARFFGVMREALANGLRDEVLGTATGRSTRALFTCVSLSITEKTEARD